MIDASDVAILPPTAEGIGEAAALLRAGNLVAFPTETVYGLGVDATNERAVAAVFAAKGRPRFNPLIVHFANPAAALAAGPDDRRAAVLAEAFWPGPLTLVRQRRDEAGICYLAGAGLETLGVRVPDHPVARELIAATGRPLAAPSANRSGAVSPTTAAHVAESLPGRVSAVLDGGPCRVGIESTVVDLTQTPAVLLRPGGIPEEDIVRVIGPLAAADGGAPRSPGLLQHHYAPSRPLRLDAAVAGPGEALLAFGPDAPQGTTLNLSPTGNLEEAAANLFAMVRALDRPPHAGIAVMPVPDRGLGRAINDRLRRAAAGSAAPANDDPDDWNENRGPAAPCLPILDDDD